MKTMNLEQMQEVNGGAFSACKGWGAVAVCVAASLLLPGAGGAIFSLGLVVGCNF